jgi:hypothetical protein
VASVRQDLARERCAIILLDPKGDAADAALSVVPEDRACTILDLGDPTCSPSMPAGERRPRPCANRVMPRGDDRPTRESRGSPRRSLVRAQRNTRRPRDPARCSSSSVATIRGARRATNPRREGRPRCGGGLVADALRRDSPVRTRVGPSTGRGPQVRRRPPVRSVRVGSPVPGNTADRRRGPAARIARGGRGRQGGVGTRRAHRPLDRRSGDLREAGRKLALAITDAATGAVLAPATSAGRTPRTRTGRARSAICFQKAPAVAAWRPGRCVCLSTGASGRWASSACRRSCIPTTRSPPRCSNDSGSALACGRRLPRGMRPLRTDARRVACAYDG